MHDFDREIDRRATCDLKWNKGVIEANLHTEIPEDFIPMWIADTDFACAPHIVQAVRRRAEQEIYGYCAPPASFYKAVCWWEKQRFQWDVPPASITALPSVVAGINIAIRTLTQEGDGVIVQPPVYDPFFSIVQRSGRTVVNNALVQKDGRYEMDFDLLERQAAEPDNKLLILCSPHNPVGRVWSEAELRRLADICLAHGVTVVTDEIHSDIVYASHTHRPLLSLDARCAEHFIHLTAPSKTFNVPGLKMSLAIIPNAALKERFEATQVALSLDIRNNFGVEGVTAAYTPESEPWVQQQLDYLSGNLDVVQTFLRERLPKIRMTRPEGTFLCWLDCTALGLPEPELLRRVNLEAGVICVPGTWFGAGGAQHLRLNVGCTRATLRRALERLAAALQ